MKKKYSAPRVVSLPQEIHANALYAAAIFLTRAIARECLQIILTKKISSENK